MVGECSPERKWAEREEPSDEWPQSGRIEVPSEDLQDRHSAPEPGSCVLVGPPGSGKTSFLVSIASAFERERRSDWTRFVPGSRLAGLLSATAPSLPGADPREPSAATALSGWSTYSFQLGLNSAAAGEEQSHELELSVLDTPGAFFDALESGDSGTVDQPAVIDLIRATRNARCLVLCVDAERDVPPQPLDLAGVINHLLGYGEVRLPRVGAKAWPGSEPPWQRAPRLELPFERVLVLLTHVEALCARAAEALAGSLEDWRTIDPAELKSLLGYGFLDAWEIAELLDVPALLQQRVAGLDALQASLKPGARLAVSALATNGFASGPKRRQEFLSGWRPRDELVRRPELRDRAGVPFGVWPALLFMASGRVIHPVRLVTRRKSTAAATGGIDIIFPTTESNT